MNGNDPRDRSIPELLGQLADQTGTLIRQELALARAELTEKAKPYIASAGMFGAAALLGLGAFAAFTTAIIVAIGLVLPVWASALIVMVLYGVLALGFLRTATAAVRDANLIPTQTIETTKEDIAWAKTRATSARR